MHIFKCHWPRLVSHTCLGSCRFHEKDRKLLRLQKQKKSQLREWQPVCSVVICKSQENILLKHIFFSLQFCILAKQRNRHSINVVQVLSFFNFFILFKTSASNECYECSMNTRFQLLFTFMPNNTCFHVLPTCLQSVQLCVQLSVVSSKLQQ